MISIFLISVESLTIKQPTLFILCQFKTSSHEVLCLIIHHLYLSLIVYALCTTQHCYVALKQSIVASDRSNFFVIYLCNLIILINPAYFDQVLRAQCGFDSPPLGSSCGGEIKLKTEEVMEVEL